MDLFQLLSSQDVNWWTGVVWITCGLLWCFYQLFGLSFWRHPFTAEHPLMRHWCRDTFLQIWWRKTHLHLEWSEGEYNFRFVSYCLYGSIRFKWCLATILKKQTCSFCRWSNDESEFDVSFRQAWTQTRQ